MANTSMAGSVGSLWRYPVKSMQGEELDASSILEGGLPGDRAYALIDEAVGKVVSAKDTRKYPNIFSFRASYHQQIAPGDDDGPLRIALPDGRVVTSQDPDVHDLLSQALGQRVRLEARKRDETTPATGFFDLAVVHLLTTSTLDHLRELYPQGRFEPARFRPNLVVRTDDSGFSENDWIGRTVRVGEQVRLEVTQCCKRCVMTTLPQGDLPHDPGILKTAAQHNEVNVGVYAKVLRGGTVKRGDALELQDSGTP